LARQPGKGNLSNRQMPEKLKAKNKADVFRNVSETNLEDLSALIISMVVVKGLNKILEWIKC
jgi:hypothetical protein